MMKAVRNAESSKEKVIDFLNKCCICGKKAMALTDMCSDCMKKAAVRQEEIERINQIDCILNLSADSIKEDIESLIEIAKEIKGGKEK